LVHDDTRFFDGGSDGSTSCSVDPDFSKISASNPVRGSDRRRACEYVHTWFNPDHSLSVEAVGLQYERLVLAMVGADARSD
jgi:hypothetical protein